MLKLGFPLGPLLTLGIPLGIALSVGYDDNEGFPDGSAEFDGSKLELGLDDGPFDGSDDGSAVGDVVGADDGLDVGARVGWEVGAAVGLVVGSWAEHSSPAIKMVAANIRNEGVILDILILGGSLDCCFSAVCGVLGDLALTRNFNIK